MASFVRQSPEPLPINSFSVSTGEDAVQWEGLTQGANGTQAALVSTDHRASVVMEDDNESNSTFLSARRRV